MDHKKRNFFLRASFIYTSEVDAHSIGNNHIRPNAEVFGISFGFYLELKKKNKKTNIGLTNLYRRNIEIVLTNL